MQAQAYDPRQVVLIGASTGGVDALAKILCHFHKLTPPALIVQHTGGRFVKSLIRLLDGATAAAVEPAVHDAPIRNGTVYFAPCDTLHLGISQKCGRKIALTSADPVSGHRPSVDVLFGSAVPHAHKITAALLTGMGQDGARGLKALRNAGAHTIAQDQATSVVYGMPRIAVEMGAAKEQLSLEQIGPALLSAAKLKVRA
jgi:two-component system chemotaxis response regulator CheB